MSQPRSLPLMPDGARRRARAPLTTLALVACALLGATAATATGHTPHASGPRGDAARGDAPRAAIVVAGTVQAEGGRPIVGAQLLVPGTQHRASSDAAGGFTLTLEAERGDTLELLVRAIGYEAQTMPLAVTADTLRPTITLHPATTRLSGVVVTGIAGADAGQSGVVGAPSPIMLRGAASISGKVAPEPSRGARFDTEEYARIEDNPFLTVASAPLSTFSIDVDRASYANVRRFLITEGRLPPQDAVRIEELVNYFPYDVPEPEGDAPVAITTEVTTAPWAPAHRLVRIALQAPRLDLEALPPTDLVFLIDVSGSMQDHNKLPLVKQSLSLLVDALRPDDRVAIAVYAGAAGLVLPPTPARERETILAAIGRLEAGGSTAGGAGIRLAYDVARRMHGPGRNTRVVLATDGDFNVGVSSTSELTRLVEERRAEGTWLTVLGFGMGNYKDGRLEQLADRGNGNYAYIDDLHEAQKVLVREMGGTLATVAKDVKLQLEFNPRLVHAYRLIGYENRLLEAEDFDDDRKDAGEIGAGHTVTALYEVIPVGARTGADIRSVPELRYQEERSTSRRAARDELLTVSLRYKPPTDSTSRLLQHVVRNRVATPSTDLHFVSSVAAFGMLLRESPHRGDASYAMVRELAAAGRGPDASGDRGRFMDLVDAAERLTQIAVTAEHEKRR